jgi:hypothetical protein
MCEKIHENDSTDVVIATVLWMNQSFCRKKKSPTESFGEEVEEPTLGNNNVAFS